MLAKQKNQPKSVAASESSGSAEGLPEPGPSRPALSRKRSRKAQDKGSAPDINPEHESEPVVAPPRPRPKPKAKQSSKSAALPENMSDAVDTATEAVEERVQVLAVSDKGKGKVKGTKIPRKRKTREEGEPELTAPPPKKRRGGKVAAQQDADTISEHVSFQYTHHLLIISYYRCGRLSSATSLQGSRL